MSKDIVIEATPIETTGPTVRDVAMASYLAPRAVGEENLIEMCATYIRHHGSDVLANEFLSQPTISLHHNFNERAQITMVNKHLGEMLLKHRAVNDQINITRVLLNVDNNLPKQSWFNVITSGVILFFINNKLSFA